VAKFSGRAALVSSRRDMGFQRTSKHQIGYRLGRGMFDKVLTVSEKVRQYSIAQDKLDPARVKTLYSPVDIAKLEVSSPVVELRERFGLSQASHVIVAVGNIRRVKGFDTLLHTAALVCREFPKAMFAIGGAFETAEPGYVAQLENLIKELNISKNVKFLGAVEPVAPLLKASDIFCLLSRTEGLPNALLEAMACGIPCVATRVGGNEEVIEDGSNGFLVASGDYRAAAAQICALLRNRSLAVRTGSQARESIHQNFSAQVVTSQLVQVYNELLHARRLAGRSRAI
jgi:glycosyltransferase involved in cell wall biosynthesis